ncbi:phage tail fiber protein [Acinetobacter soli]|uniref:phage tail fiber protein n=1 Tax=Acinetobacter soli TaxID=487316 RepID=UPI002091CFC9|nr:hypothetical protein [Acinetobacter soli]
MSKMSINIGNSANDGNGEPARSAFNKTNKNFDEVYVALGAEDGTLPAAIPISKGGTGASNVEEARKKLSAFAVGNQGGYINSEVALNYIKQKGAGIYYYFGHGEKPAWNNGHFLGAVTEDFCTGLIMSSLGSLFYMRKNPNSAYVQHEIKTEYNTTIDANGFIKSASPIAKLFADKVEPNNEAAEQNIVFQKIDVGHYLIKGSSGFAQQGWYIETPKDANGNILFAVNYEQLENGDIEVKTYKKKFDLESASIVADLENPVDIAQDRWIDIRLQEVPKPVPEMPTEEVNSDEPQQ